MRTSRLVSMLLLLQVKGRVTAQALAEEFEVSMRTVYRDIDQRPEPAPLLPRLASAVWEQKRITMRYASWGTGGDRRREPLGLVLKAGDWYLIARVRTQTRIYKVASITHLTVLDEVFERPASFDLRAQWSSAVAAFEKGLLKGVAKLSLSPEGMKRLHRLGAVALEQARRGPFSDDGWQEVTIPVEGLVYAGEQLLSLGEHVQVLEPPELRERVRQLAERVVALNAP
ncbi:transcriptional regulator [Paraburkholderia sp. BL10I2N1]|uniref:helix-turn-helix transcriptional regulator n=1 Tax=Paraburkholderia sp. BL10I2N1 TaxID=1938796 RepID=UPI00105C1C84|nr:transcriptional regulator [Paraburkholderia sp. BL10I2N1]TDN63691.1 HTH domain-containing protein [Paraburkholderia sp. BL10I2N1]